MHLHCICTIVRSVQRFDSHRVSRYVTRSRMVKRVKSLAASVHYENRLSLCRLYERILRGRRVSHNIHTHARACLLKNVHVRVCVCRAPHTPNAEVRA